MEFKLQNTWLVKRTGGKKKKKAVWQKVKFAKKKKRLIRLSHLSFTFVCFLGYLLDHRAQCLPLSASFHRHHILFFFFFHTGCSDCVTYMCVSSTHTQKKRKQLLITVDRSTTQSPPGLQLVHCELHHFSKAKPWEHKEKRTCINKLIYTYIFTCICIYIHFFIYILASSITGVNGPVGNPCLRGSQHR